MKKQDLIEEIKNVMQREKNLTLEMELKDIEEWDSLTVVGIAALYDKFMGIKIEINDINKCKTISDIVKLAGDKVY